jgi:hypothetical protein
MRPGDKITARLFGQNLTLQRCEWEQLRDETIPGTELHNRAEDIALWDRDEPTDSTYLEWRNGRPIAR